jgi:hypothetical protein
LLNWLTTYKIYDQSARPKLGTAPLTVLNNPICSCVTGQPDVLKSTSGRIVMLTSYMTSLVLMAAYSAFVISSLAVQRHHLPFRDLQGLLGDGSYRLGVVRNSSKLNYFQVWGINYLWPDYLVILGLGFMKEAGKVWKHAVSVVFYSVITARLTDVLILSKSYKLILQDVIARLAFPRSFYQQLYHNNRRRVQWY